MAQVIPNSTLPPTPSPVGFHCGRGLPRCMLERGPLLLPPPQVYMFLVKWQDLSEKVVYRRFAEIYEFHVSALCVWGGG